MVDTSSISSLLAQYNVPEVILAVAGLIAIGIAFLYMKNKDGVLYKMSVLVGLVAGAALVITMVGSGDAMSTVMKVLAIILAFALIIRPFRNMNLAILFALLAFVLVFLAIGSSDIEFLTNMTVRVVVSLVIAAVIFMLFQFIGGVAQLFGKIINAWPVLILLGLLCLAEGVCMYMGYSSPVSFIMSALGK